KGTDAPDVTMQTFTFKNSTVYNFAYTKNFFTHRQNSQKWLTYDVQNSIFVNCGKSGQVIKGVNGGGSSANPTWVINGNIFNFDGADTSAAESTGDDEEPVQNSIVGVVTFADAAAGDFNGTFTYPFGTTAPESLGGDARWTITIAEGEDLSGIESIAVVAAQKDGKFFIDGKLVIVRNGRQFNANGQILK
ncbi:MAG: DUF5123 domain-containing protein, partial [Bacteroidales bacterium]|nr:DUF5123 domain-containing protein [Bacteroidales bacterium]